MPQEVHRQGLPIVYVELGDDGFVLRQVDAFENGMLSRYDRAHWDDQFGTLADFRFGPTWLRHWGTPEVIPKEEFEKKWAAAGETAVFATKRPSSRVPPPWIGH